MANVMEFLISKWETKEKRTKVKELDIGNMNLEGHLNLEDFTELEKVIAFNNESNQKLSKLFLTNNRLEGEIDFSDNPELTTLFCPRNDISSFNFSKNKKLKFLDLANTRIQEESFKKQFSEGSSDDKSFHSDLPKEKIKFSTKKQKQREREREQLKAMSLRRSGGCWSIHAWNYSGYDLV